MTDGPTPDLVADDNCVSRRLVAARRRNAGYRVAKESNGTTALAQFERESLVVFARPIVAAAARDPLQAGRHTVVAIYSDGVATLGERANRNQYGLHCETPHTHSPGVSRHTGRSRACG